MKRAVVERVVAENCFEVEPGLYRILLPLPWTTPFVNAWLLHSGGQWALVDCGLNWGPSLRALGRALKAAGVPAGGLTHLLLTHGHDDHASAANSTHARWGGQVWLHAADLAQRRRSSAEIQEWLSRHGVAGTLLEQAGARRTAQAVEYKMPARVEPLEPGQVLMVGDLQLEVIGVPGHSPGQVMLREAARGWLFSADHVLPSANWWAVWFEAWATGDPLGQYLAQLERASGVTCRLVLPGHGLPFPGAELPGLCAGAVRFHRERVRGVLRKLGSDELTAHALAMRESPLLAGGASTVGQAVAESMAVLAYLHHTGAVLRTERGGQELWRAAVAWE